MAFLEAASLVSQGAGSAIEAWLNYKMMRRQERLAAEESERNRDERRMQTATGLAAAKSQERADRAKQNRYRRLMGRILTNSFALYGGPNTGPNSALPTPPTGAMRALPSAVPTPNEIGQVSSGLRRVM